MAGLVGSIIAGGLGFLGGLFQDSGSDVAAAGKYEAYPGQKSIAKAITPYLWESLNKEKTATKLPDNSLNYAKGTIQDFVTRALGTSGVNTDTSKYANASYLNKAMPSIEANLGGLTGAEKTLYTSLGKQNIMSGVKSSLASTSKSAASQGLRGGTIANILANVSSQTIPAMGKLGTDISQMDIAKKQQAIQDIISSAGIQKDLFGLGVTERGQDITKLLGEQSNASNFMSTLLSSEQNFAGLDLAAKQFDLAKEQAPITNILNFLNQKAGTGNEANLAADLNLQNVLDNDQLQNIKDIIEGLFKKYGGLGGSDYDRGGLNEANTGNPGVGYGLDAESGDFGGYGSGGDFGGWA